MQELTDLTESIQICIDLLRQQGPTLRVKNALTERARQSSDAKESSKRGLASHSQRPPESFSTIPYPRDPDFVNRANILAWVNEKCAGPAARVALVGPGGVGYVYWSPSAVCQC